MRSFVITAPSITRTTTIEASRSTGTTAWQEITQVQLPMAKGSLVLAANQGLLYVLAMVVIGGLVGAGALGYDVVLGFSRSEEWGKGAAAGKGGKGAGGKGGKGAPAGKGGAAKGGAATRRHESCH